MTKLMTAIVALQYADVDTAHYVVGSEQSLVKKPDSSMAYLEQGWDMPLKALIHAMLLPSGLRRRLHCGGGRRPGCGRSRAVR